MCVRRIPTFEGYEAAEHPEAFDLTLDEDSDHDEADEAFIDNRYP